MTMKYVIFIGIASTGRGSSIQNALTVSPQSTCVRNHESRLSHTILSPSKLYQFLNQSCLNVTSEYQNSSIIARINTAISCRIFPHTDLTTYQTRGLSTTSIIRWKAKYPGDMKAPRIDNTSHNVMYLTQEQVKRYQVAHHNSPKRMSTFLDSRLFLIISVYFPLFTLRHHMHLHHSKRRLIFTMKYAMYL